MLSPSLFQFSFLLINAALLLSYCLQGVNKGDFGTVNPNLHAYMLISAGLAYLINLFHVLVISNSVRNESPFQIAALAYYFLQLFFIPAVRLGNGNLVRFLLGICILPIAYLHSLSNTNESIFSLFVLLHVAINDFAMYGFLHDR